MWVGAIADLAWPSCCVWKIGALAQPQGVCASSCSQEGWGGLGQRECQLAVRETWLLSAGPPCRLTCASHVGFCAPA